MSQSDNLGIDRKKLIQLYRQALVEQGSYEQVDAKVQDKLERLSVSQKIEQDLDKKHQKQVKKSLPALIRYGAGLVPIFLIVVGLLLLGSAMVPIAGSYLQNLSKKEFIAPIPQENLLNSTALAVAYQSDEDLDAGINQLKTGPVIVDAELDYTNLSNWFDDQAINDLSNRTSLLTRQTGEYVLEIPKLNIKQATVKIGGTHLEESLIQYPGTSLPGKPGSPVVFGHSVLRQFYNPREDNPRRYNSIFSTIMTLEPGDKIYLYYGDAQYTYMVQDKTEVKPTDTYILSQDYNSRQLKLVTCVPEGTSLRRGVVTAQLVKNE